MVIPGYLLKSTKSRRNVLTKNKDANYFLFVSSDVMQILEDAAAWGVEQLVFLILHQEAIKGQEGFTPG